MDRLSCRYEVTATCKKREILVRVSLLSGIIFITISYLKL